MKMPIERIIRMMAGSFVLLSLGLAQFHSRYWLWFTAFVGFNLLQSSFTNFCPAEMILRRLRPGAGEGGVSEQPSQNRSCCSR